MTTSQYSGLIELVDIVYQTHFVNPAYVMRVSFMRDSGGEPWRAYVFLTNGETIICAADTTDDLRAQLVRLLEPRP